MEQVVDRVLLLPRFTSFAGTGTFLTAPLNVRAYSRASFTYVHVGALGTIGPIVEVYVQESSDLEIWLDIGDDINTLETELRDFRLEWIRLKLVVTGSDPGFTCWCVGEFVPRQP